MSVRSLLCWGSLVALFVGGFPIPSMIPETGMTKIAEAKPKDGKKPKKEKKPKKPPTVPEPGSMLLVAGGMAAAGLVGAWFGLRPRKPS